MADYTSEIEKNATPCVFCGSKPKIIHYEDGVWYAECSNIQCKNYIPFRHLGLRKTVVLEKWEYENRTIQRKQYKKGKKDANYGV